MQRLAAGAKVPGPHLTSPSINEAPPTRRRAGRLVRVAYHAACWEMGSDGCPWMDLALVCGAGYWWKGMLSPRPPPAGISTPPGRPLQRSDLSNQDVGVIAKPAAFRLHGGRRCCCYLQPDFALLVLYMAVCSSFIYPTRYHPTRAHNGVCPGALQWCA